MLRRTDARLNGFTIIFDLLPIDLALVPEQHRDAVEEALVSAFGRDRVTGMQVVIGGASGALTYRIESAVGTHLLRIEGAVGALRNPHQYAAMRIAAEAGIAPPIRYLNEGAGVLVMPFIDQVPLADLPGGPPAIAAQLGGLLRRLHDTTPPFERHRDHLDNLAKMLGFLERSGRVAPGLLARHVEEFERIRAAYPWRPETFVSAHNDPNQFNVLYDGDRLWLIDWETASRNDPFIDVATAISYAGPTPRLRDDLLRGWLGAEPDDLARARAAVMGAVVRLYAGCILLVVVVDPVNPEHTDLTAMSGDEFRIGIESGTLVAGQIATTLAYARLVLQSFLDIATTTDHDRALRRVALA